MAVYLAGPDVPVTDKPSDALVERLLRLDADTVVSGKGFNSIPIAINMRKAADEIERLQSVADAEMKLREGNFARIESLQARLVEAERDARRYRYVRDHPKEFAITENIGFDWITLDDPNRADAHIDLAIEGSGK